MPKPTKPIRWIQFSPSIAKDVTTYRIRMVPSGKEIAYSGSYTDVGLGRWNSHTRKLTIDLYKIPGYRDVAKGNYDFGLTAVDKGDNESDFTLFYSVQAGFSAVDKIYMSVMDFFSTEETVSNFLDNYTLKL
jgi:hypothetical protein